MFSSDEEPPKAQCPGQQLSFNIRDDPGNELFLTCVVIWFDCTFQEASVQILSCNASTSRELGDIFIFRCISL